MQAAEEIDTEVNKLGRSLKGPDQIIAPIARYQEQANAFEGQVDNLLTLARLNRWATGRLLLVVKERLKHGQFERWLEDRRDMLGFSKSSAENYMKLARDYTTARRFLEKVAPLREMYARGEAQKETDPLDTKAPKDSHARSTERPTKMEAMMKTMTGLQKCLRHVSESEEKLDKGQLDQLKLVKIELDRFFEKLIADNP
jgi:hypothetical protein